MKYFTPELYLQFNSPDPSLAETAQQAWEDAVERYHQHIAEIGPRMTASARQVVNSLCLHDAEYVGIELTFLPEQNGKLAIVMVHQGKMAVFLVYMLLQEPLIEEFAPWPFSKEHVHWLYDEFDVQSGGGYQHQVLLSDGRVVTLRFRDIRHFEFAPEKTVGRKRKPKTQKRGA
jgi:hypothetical protein